MSIYRISKEFTNMKIMEKVRYKNIIMDHWCFASADFVSTNSTIHYERGDSIMLPSDTYALFA